MRRARGDSTHRGRTRRGAGEARVERADAWQSAHGRKGALSAESAWNHGSVTRALRAPVSGCSLRMSMKVAPAASISKGSCSSPPSGKRSMALGCGLSWAGASMLEVGVPSGVKRRSSRVAARRATHGAARRENTLSNTAGGGRWFVVWARARAPCQPRWWSLLRAGPAVLASPLAVAAGVPFWRPCGATDCRRRLQCRGACRHPQGGVCAGWRGARVVRARGARRFSMRAC